MSSDHPLPETGLPAPVMPDISDDPTARWPQLRRVGTHVPLREYLREVVRRREFLVAVPFSELKARNQDSVLGQLWHLLNPLMLIGMYYLIFAVVLGIEERRGVDNFLPFLIVGILTFNYTRSCAQAGARAMTKNRRLMQSMNFPRAILPFSALVAESLAHLYSLPIMLVMAMLVPGGPRPMVSWLLLVPALIVQAVFNLGVLMIVARLTFHFRDVQQFLPYMLRLVLYGSGVIFPVNADLITNDTLLTILQINPMFNIIELTRGAVLYGEVVPRAWIISIASALVLFVVGFVFFRRAENEYGNV
ncbi:MAG: ABC transporter permease [Nitriliruptoraceae bacterium]